MELQHAIEISAQMQALYLGVGCVVTLVLVALAITMGRNLR